LYDIRFYSGVALAVKARKGFGKYSLSVEIF
jgi:hypothetical protein